MSRLVQALRNKKRDTEVKPVPSAKKKPKMRKFPNKQGQENTTSKNSIVSNTIFTNLLTIFYKNKDTVNKLNKQNTENREKILTYIKENGARTDKGHSLVKVDNLIGEVRRSVATVLNSDAVEKLLHKLKKNKIISKKQYEKVFFSEHSIVLSQTQYSILRPHLEQAGVIVDTRHRIDEDELKLLLTQGLVTVTELEKCYTSETKESLYVYEHKGSED